MPGSRPVPRSARRPVRRPARRAAPRLALVAALLALLAGLPLGTGCAPKRVLREPGAAPPPAGAPRSEPPASTTPRTPAPGTGGGSAAARALELGVQAAGVAHAQLGRPYRWGGEQPGTGFDCSGLVHFAFGSVGVDLPRVVREQERVGRAVPPSELQPGDLVFFATRGSRSDHVGVFLGAEQFVHAPRAGKPVRLDSLDDPFWQRRWTGARRVTGAW